MALGTHAKKSGGPVIGPGRHQPQRTSAPVVSTNNIRGGGNPQSAPPSIPQQNAYLQSQLDQLMMTQKAQKEREQMRRMNSMRGQYNDLTKKNPKKKLNMDNPLYEDQARQKRVQDYYKHGPGFANMKNPYSKK